ncbi:MAG: T9SS type A sorting domain-containing protein [Bacteroidetes bacterium]|nr:T9SS type A sorting domain-containing protein [Bacteroidota bacterium]
MKNNLPAKFSLSQNYPNPFNPTTTINYLLPQTSFVTIKVYDVLGNEVATLVNEEKKAGSYSVQLSAVSKQLASGVYFYRMRAGDFVETRKLLLLK